MPNEPQTLSGKLISESRDGKRAQITVPHGAYARTYHCHKSRGKWETNPDKSGSYFIIVVA